MWANRGPIAGCSHIALVPAKLGRFWACCWYLYTQVGLINENPKKNIYIYIYIYK
ncbi:hypothetical protein Hanom_Chr14g01314731 [Helianthus anomalus]